MLFFIDDNGFLEWFKSKDGLENKLEAVDVRNGLYRIFDEQGFELNLLTKNVKVKPLFSDWVEAEGVSVGEPTSSNYQLLLFQLMLEKFRRHNICDESVLDFDSAKKIFVKQFASEDDESIMDRLSK